MICWGGRLQVMILIAYHGVVQLSNVEVVVVSPTITWDQTPSQSMLGGCPISKPCHQTLCTREEISSWGQFPFSWRWWIRSMMLVSFPCLFGFTSVIIEIITKIIILITIIIKQCRNQNVDSLPVLWVTPSCDDNHHDDENDDDAHHDDESDDDDDHRPPCAEIRMSAASLFFGWHRTDLFIAASPALLSDYVILSWRLDDDGDAGDDDNENGGGQDLDDDQYHDGDDFFDASLVGSDHMPATFQMRVFGAVADSLIKAEAGDQRGSWQLNSFDPTSQLTNQPTSQLTNQPHRVAKCQRSCEHFPQERGKKRHFRWQRQCPTAPLF